MNSSNPSSAPNYREHLLKTLEQVLEKYVQNPREGDSLFDVYSYALLPPGKLFRPILSFCAYKDLWGQDPLEDKQLESLSICAVALEIHHTYTLIHDDMPCMDDDDFRRNRPSVHKKFGEWRALLAGDGLLNLSYLLVCLHSPQLVYWMAKLCGVNGLIQGQFLDLQSSTEKRDLHQIDRIHLLKTGRLIQLSLLTGFFTSPKHVENPKYFFILVRLGYYLGLYFQYKDDWDDYSQNEGGHEKMINPFYSHYELASKKLNLYEKKVKELLNRYQLKNLESYIFSIF